MITYDENLDVKRKKRKKSEGINPWDITEQMPLQWLLEVDMEGNIVPFGEGVFGVGVYDDGSVASGFRLETLDAHFLGEDEANQMHQQMIGVLTSMEKEDHVQFLWNSVDEDEEV